MLVVTLDASRLSDPDIAPEPERDRLKAIAGRYSAEDLMRAFDVLSKAEFEVRGSAQPRYHLEMALLKLVHLRKLAPIGDLLASLGGSQAIGQRPQAIGPKTAPPPQQAPGSRPQAPGVKTAPSAPPPAPKSPSPVPTEKWEAVEPAAPAAPPSDLKAAILAELQKKHKHTHGMLTTGSERIELSGDTITIALKAGQRLLDAPRTALEAVASQVAGRKIAVKAIEGGSPKTGAAADEERRKDELKKKALEQPSVQSLIDVFGADIQEVEELDR